jgi:hypothetical protein
VRQTQPNNPTTVKAGLPFLVVGVVLFASGVAPGWGLVAAAVGVFLIVAGGD